MADKIFLAIYLAAIVFLLGWILKKIDKIDKENRED